MTPLAHNLNANITASQTAYVPLWRDLRVLNVLLIAGALSLFAAYLGMNNRVAQKGFVIRNIEREILKLQDERQKLNLSVVSDQSMEALNSKVAGLGMVPVTAVEYVADPNGSVAVR